MVTFISQCEKKALNRTRRVLDAFANRIGSNSWQTIITEEGLIAVKNLLKKTATKNTAVSCHWIRSRSRSELVWIVGNRDQFNSEGLVAVNITQKNLLNKEWENDWHYLPAIKALVAISALLHDWGKATELFQEKLTHKKTKNIGDPLRHEWISCLLLNALVQQAGNNDESWLKLLSEGIFDEQKLKNLVSKNVANPLDNLPPIAQLVAWLIITHHRLPFLYDDKERNEYSDCKRSTISEMLKSVKAQWGYQNETDNQRLKKCFEFPNGLLSQSQQWLKQLKKWSARLLESQTQIQQLIENGSYRLLLHHARLCLMLGDHFYSSCDANNEEKWSVNLFANTDKKTGKPKQKLDEHLVKVSEYGLKISQSLSRFSTEMGLAYDIKSLKQKSSKGFEWQDKAVAKIDEFKKQNSNHKDFGYFVVNIASTGCGKTIANAKVMRALSEDGESLRFILALGLRTLTLQTGDEYREKIGLGKDELAVLIGSSVIKELHEKSKKEEKEENAFEEIGSESLEELLSENLDDSDAPTADFLDAVIPKNNANKLKAFLYKPVLACTIDHIMSATETTRGGKYILPCLRLLSSDLVIDEIDDFNEKDLIAIGRLIHLAAMLGRKVMISSATIPPSLAEGFLNTYQEGWKIHANFKKSNQNIACIWIDEFNSEVELIDKNESVAGCESYRNFHQKFITKRITNLEKQTVRRKGFIVKIDELLLEKTDQQKKYFEKIRQTVIKLHQQHNIVDATTGKLISFGVVRTANIPPCIELARYLLETNWEENFAPKIMAYHSRQVLLLRHEQEKHLDEVLKRKEKSAEIPEALKNKVIRAHLDSTAAKNVIFILVATPVEEVGRDHDFDWAIVEPSSYRSIIQLSGRVRRHRKSEIREPNVAVMQYNLRALRQSGKAENPAFCRPGYETSKTLKLSNHDLCKLIDEAILEKSINAIPRIQQQKKLNPQENLSDLEHQAMQNVLTSYNKNGPNNLQAWLTESWWLTALPQQLNRFRESAPETKLFLVWREGKLEFCEKNESGEFTTDRSLFLNIEKLPQLLEEISQKLWLKRNYKELLEKYVDEDDDGLSKENSMNQKSKKYGEINMLSDSCFTGPKGKHFYSDQFGLWK
jgi:CRISPR-associated endonuclease/helicase Cas3